MRDTSSRKHNDSALSEVIGFVLILGLIGIVASLYLTYGVPAQGREDEITHMNVIKDEFIGYKLSLDSLFIPAKTDTTMSNSFTLGTKGAFTEGMMSIVPVMNPASSGGIIAINDQRPENLTISSDSLILHDTRKYRLDLPAQVNYTPSHVYVNISYPQSLDPSTGGPYGATVNTTSWIAYINLTPQMTFYQYYKRVDVGTTTTCNQAGMNTYGPAINVYTGTSSNSAYSCLVPTNAYTNTTDLTLTIKKDGLVTIQNYSIYHNIQSGPTYTVDLMNDIYGLKSSINPGDSLNIANQSITANGNISYDFVENPTYKEGPIALGAVEYRSQNNYWINQNYYYQLGGVFLSQIDGNTSYKLPPEISFAMYRGRSPSEDIVDVNINALTIDGVGKVGGNSPVQLKSSLTNITPLSFAPTTKHFGNTKSINISIDTTDPQAQAMWRNYFTYTAMANNITGYYVSPSGNPVYIRIKGSCDDDKNSNCPFDINVIASRATFSTSIHGIGGTVQ